MRDVCRYDNNDYAFHPNKPMFDVSSIIIILMPSTPRFKNEPLHTKTGLKTFFIVMPKEGLALCWTLFLGPVFFNTTPEW